MSAAVEQFVKEAPEPWDDTISLTERGLEIYDPSVDKFTLVAGHLYAVSVPPPEAEGEPSWRLQVILLDLTGRRHDLHFPRSWLAGDGSMLLAALWDAGLLISSEPEAETALLRHLRDCARVVADERPNTADRMTKEPIN